MGSISQDALLLTGSALFLSIFSQIASTKRTPSIVTNLGLTALLVAIAWGRLPYLLLGSVFLLKPFSDVKCGTTIFRRWPGLVAIAIAVVLTGLWIKIISGLQIDLRPSVSAKDQLHFLLGHIQFIPKIAFYSLQSKEVILQLVGVLGWLNIDLPKFFYLTGFAGMLTALALDMMQPCFLEVFERAILALALLVGVGFVYLALYLTWTPVGLLSVEGVQGRYFIPFVISLAFVVPAATPRVRRLFRPLVLLLPVVSIIGAVISIQRIIHYYI